MSQRRELSFARLDDVLPEVERLLAGHTTVGNWSLGQILSHLAAVIEVSVEGGAAVTSPEIAALLADEEGRRRVAVFRQRLLEKGRIAEGAPIPSERLVPVAESDAATEAQRFREAVARFCSAAGPLPNHPALGPMTRSEWERFHCVHCAHHLGFVLPA
jgi:hypothetical protein